MPYSDPDNKAVAAEWLSEIQPVTVLDVGPGAGAYGQIARTISSVGRVDAVEAWEPYLAEFGLRNLYDNVFVEDVRDRQDFTYDVVIFGDVLEHMTKEDALRIYELARGQAKWILFSIPIIHLPQGAYAGNPFEIHVHDNWTHKEILDWFPNVERFETFRVTGIYLTKC